MADGYSRSPKLLKGALVQFSAPLIVPIPNIIIFQYNPASITRSLAPFDFQLVGAPEPKAPGTKDDPKDPADKPVTVQPYDPTEEFNLSLLLDATDALEATDPIATVTGVADRLAALEMLLYPSGGGLLGGLSISIDVSIGAGGASFGAEAALAPADPSPLVPIVLFVWGPGRIVPVRVKSFSVEETQHNHLLYPHRATVSLGMQVLTSKDLAYDTRTEAELAKVAYKFTRAQKEGLALLNVANTVESILGMLPF
ncbi:MAG: hypothetical protein AAGF12_16545 [Myxococcota bacterium]